MELSGLPDNSATKVSLQTFGCKVNTYDSGLLQRRLKDAGYFSADNKNGLDIHILNTCAVTAEATKEAVRSIRKIKSKNPASLVVVTGCAAQVDTEIFRNLSGADLVVANSHKGQLEDIIKKHLRGEIDERVFHSNIFRKEDLEGGGGIEEGHTRAFLKIQDGCNSFCTYCVIPFARGKSRSLSVNELVARIDQLSAEGFKEVVLTGVHIGDYIDESSGKNLVLEDLIENVLARTIIPRIRLTSLEPVELSDRLIDLFSNTKLCPHFHMSIQSASTDVLKLMRRNYSAEQVRASLEKINSRIPDAYVGMDVIVGFPQESDQHFEETFDLLESTPWTRIHVFPYSERPGTKAVNLTGKVRPEVISGRALRLRELSQNRYTEVALRQIGSIKSVLVLSKPISGEQSISRDYWPVQIINPRADLIGSETKVKIIGFDHSSENRFSTPLIGQILDN